MGTDRCVLQNGRSGTLSMAARWFICLAIKVVVKLRLRQTTGMASVGLRMENLDRSAPDFMPVF